MSRSKPRRDDLFARLFEDHSAVLRADDVMELFDALEAAIRDDAFAEWLAKAQQDVEQGLERCPACKDDYCMRTFMIRIIKSDRAMRSADLRKQISQTIHQATYAAVAQALPAALEVALPAAMWENLSPLIKGAVQKALKEGLADQTTTSVAQIVGKAVQDALEERAQKAWYRRLWHRVTDYFDLRQNA